ncbi:hypothetical protein tb265_23190 [Gemmatimonadetes bacterium T265]|nr:hypothetical protein tb265_23190 [Gemmatimonadetes bacterium T265]
MSPREGFGFRARLADGLEPAAAHGLHAAFAALVAARGLEASGAFGWEADRGCVVSRARRAVREADRRAVAAWAASRAELAEYRVGPVVALGPPLTRAAP